MPFAIPLLLLFAGLLAAFTAMCGLNSDQMLFYQAALRVASGQVPYVDFRVPQGPVTPLLGGLFFTLFPTGGWAWLALSSALNMGFTLLVVISIKRISEKKHLALLAGLLSAIWFLPPMGSFYCDHLAYCFVYAAFVALLSGKASPAKSRFLVSGILLALAYHSKQTVGLAGAVALFVSYGITYPKDCPRALLHTTLGLLLGHAIVLAGIYLKSDLHRYYLATVAIPSQYAALSEDKNPIRLISFLLFPFGLSPWSLLKQPGVGKLSMAFVVTGIYGVYYWIGKLLRERNLNKETSPLLFPLLFLVLSTVWCGALLGRSHSHLFFGLAGALVLGLSAWSQKSPGRFRTGAFLYVLLVALGLGHGLLGHEIVSWGSNDPYFAGTDLNPIRVEKNADTIAMKEMIERLKEAPGPLVTAGRKTQWVTAALRRPPVQENVYDDIALTIPRTGSLRKEWQQSFIESFEKRSVKYALFHSQWEIRKAAWPIVDYVKTHYPDCTVQGDYYLCRKLTPGMRAPAQSVVPAVPKDEK